MLKNSSRFRVRGSGLGARTRLTDEQWCICPEPSTKNHEGFFRSLLERELGFRRLPGGLRRKRVLEHTQHGGMDVPVGSNQLSLR